MSDTFYGCKMCGNFWQAGYVYDNQCPCGCLMDFSACREDHSPPLDHVEESLRDAQRAASDGTADSE